MRCPQVKEWDRCRMTGVRCHDSVLHVSEPQKKTIGNIKGIIARAIYPGNTTAGQRQGGLVKSTGREKQSGSTAAGKKQDQAGCGWHSDEGSKRGSALPGDVNKPRPLLSASPFGAAAATCLAVEVKMAAVIGQFFL